MVTAPEEEVHLEAEVGRLQLHHTKRTFPRTVLIYGTNVTGFRCGRQETRLRLNGSVGINVGFDRNERQTPFVAVSVPTIRWCSISRSNLKGQACGDQKKEFMNYFLASVLMAAEPNHHMFYPSESKEQAMEQRAAQLDKTKDKQINDVTTKLKSLERRLDGRRCWCSETNPTY